ncbi:MAG: DUF5652 family protein [Candidatus Curtissbacteria bacterium]|nr:DUF5652 family protein [Candidatus Curtissbacteria bacterium]
MDLIFNSYTHLSPATGLLFLLITLWSMFWKGVALWHAANLGQKYWFIAMLILNTLGILEIIFLFKFAKRKMTVAKLRSDVQSFFRNLSSKS